MNLTHLQQTLTVAALALLALPPITLAQSSPPVIVNQGHNPVEVVYEAGSWSFFVDGTESGRGRLDPSAAVYHLTDSARLQIPANPRFAFLGNAGDPVWIAPHVENPALLFLGISGERIASGIFAGDRLGLRLTGVRGPGDFAMYGLDSGGNVELYQSSRDGIGTDETAPFGIGGHDHQNWAFNAPGHYDLTFKAEGTLAAGGVAASAEVTYRFAVGPVDPLEVPEPVAVDEGDADIAVVLRDDRLLLNVFWGAEEAEYRSNEAFYEVRANSQIPVPTDPAYSFLGSPGNRVWVAPQTDQPGKLFLALAADNLPQGVFANERVRVTLKTFEGPGTFAVYQTDAFGTPTPYFNTADGVSDADARDVIPGDHFHMNWGFTQPGTYKIGLQAQGIRVSDGQTVVSELTTFQFKVLEPVAVDEGDADIAVVLRDDRLLLNVFWGAEEAEYRSDEAFYEVRANSQIPVPTDPAYSFLGSPGDRVWVAPQTDQPGKLFLALAADNLPQGVFANERVRVTLKTFEGPGTFAVYQTDAFGTPTTYFNTADGVSDADARDVIPGDHFHMNWGFTQPGTYKVGLQAQGIRVSDGHTVASELTQFTFRVVGEDGLQLGIARSSQDRLTLSWTGTQGASYQLQRRTSLGSGDWEPLGAPVAGTGSPQSVETTVGSDAASEYYRLLQQP